MTGYHLPGVGTVTGTYKKQPGQAKKPVRWHDPMKEEAKKAVTIAYLRMMRKAKMGKPRHMTPLEQKVLLRPAVTCGPSCPP